MLFLGLLVTRFELPISADLSDNSGSVSDGGLARGETTGVLFMKDAWSRLRFSVGVVANVELVAVFLFWVPLLDWLRVDIPESSPSIGLLTDF